MKLQLLISLLIFKAGIALAQPSQRDSIRYLALGDSYTVGRYVEQSESFPFQLVKKLNDKHILTAQPVLIAQNGWRTDELIKGIEAQAGNAQYDIVTLLIGVNNQYQKKDIDTYRTEFLQLINTAIKLAKGNPKHVFILSIPDWGATPFANGRDQVKIAAEIDAYNEINKLITKTAGSKYIDIT
ncbi:MAG: SGNH/GDSL hydrolase family protein, partial [Sphingobacteriales bacterium]